MRHSLKRLWYEVPLFRVVILVFHKDSKTNNTSLNVNNFKIFKCTPHSVYIQKTQIENATQVRSRR